MTSLQIKDGGLNLGVWLTETDQFDCSFFLNRFPDNRTQDTTTQKENRSFG
jgi:hypothetical protein